MASASARTARGAGLCLLATAGALVLVLTTHAQKLVEYAGFATPDRLPAAAGRTDLPTGVNRQENLARAIPRPSWANDNGGSGGVAGPGFPGTSQAAGFEPGEGFVLGHIDGQVGWASFADQTQEAHVSDVNPGTGVQHLRVGHDDTLGANTSVGAFSPNMGSFTETSATVSVDVFITGTGRDYQVVPQSQTEELVLTRVRFRRLNNIIDVLDDPGGGGQFVDTGSTWIPDQYVNLTIDYDAVAGSIEIFYNGGLIYTLNGVPFGTAVEETVLFGINGAAATGLVDFDEYSVLGGTPPEGACCNFDGMSGCMIMNSLDCAAAGGSYLGNGTLCADCPIGACCNIDGMDGCLEMSPEQCATFAPDGFYLGDGTICADCPIVPKTCGSGGDCLTAHPDPGCDDIACCALVCDQIPPCCLFEWDASCAAAALDTFCTPDPACGVPGTGDCFEANGSMFCDDNCGVDGPCPGCCDTICAVDPFCCETEWDALCVGEAQDLCGCTPQDTPPNDDCANAIEIFTGTTAVTNFCGTSGGPNHDTCNDGFVNGLGIDVWYFYVATFDGALTITHDVLKGNWLTQLAAYEGSDCNALSDPPLACATGNTATVPVVNGETYIIRLGGTFDGPTGSGTLTLAAVPDACLTSPNDCLAAGVGPGCSDLSCCAIVCLADPTCCDTEWDQVCADLAASSCAPMPCGDIDLSSATVEENELCGTDANGGCNSVPPLFTPIVSGDIVHGDAWADGGTRDTDWYSLTIDPAADVNGNGDVDIHFNIKGELPVVSFLIRDLDPTCGAGGTDGPGNIAYGQNCTQVNPGVGTVQVGDTIYVFAGTADEAGNPFFDGYPCPIGPVAGNDYLLCVTVTDDGELIDTSCPPEKSQPCPYDCQVDAGGVPNPDGNVGINDFLTLLAQWQMAGTTCDVDPNDMGAGINDFLALLAAWGPCP